MAHGRNRAFYRHIIGLPLSVYIIAGVRSLSPYVVIPLGFLAFVFAWLFIAAGAHAGSWDHERRDGGADLRFKKNTFHYHPSPEERALWATISKSMRNWGMFAILFAVILSMLRSREPESPIQSTLDMRTAVDLAAPLDLTPTQPQPDRQRHRKRKQSKAHSSLTLPQL